jgi:hypothetical protein
MSRPTAAGCLGMTTGTMEGQAKADASLHAFPPIRLHELSQDRQRPILRASPILL